MASRRRALATRHPPRSPASGVPLPVRYRVELKPAAERGLAALEKRDRLRVVRKIDALAVDPRPPGAEKLKGEDDLWRIRVGDYRVLYVVRDKVLLVVVVQVGHRREVYRSPMPPSR